MPTRSNVPAGSRGDEIETQLRSALQAVERAPLPGARDLAIIAGFDSRGNPLRHMENLVIETATLLAKSGHIYGYGDTIVMESQRLDGSGPDLVPLRTGPIIERGAEHFLANHFLCGGAAAPITPPRKFVETLLRSDHIRKKLPRIKTYARRPIFDLEFNLCSHGFTRQTGVLVHGFPIEAVDESPGSLDLPPIDRLPVHLRTLLRGFCLFSAADLVNTVGILLTVMLIHHFIDDGKPVLLIDANQPAIGKTLLAIVIGILLDGRPPRLTQFTMDDDELQKRMCATLRDQSQSLLLLDNAKTRGGQVLSSQTIEANSLAPMISLRILGQSANFTRPNDCIWAVTMNDTRASPDLVSRGLPIQLYFEGNPAERNFTGCNPVEYALAHRRELFGELAGMIMRWNQLGRPHGCAQHRCGHWAAIVGGILEAANLPDLLRNAATAAAAFDSSLEELAALAEAVVNGSGPFTEI